MKIYSKFQDYYDSSISAGFDENLLYLRSNSTWEKAIIRDKKIILNQWKLSNPTPEKNPQAPEILIKLQSKLNDETTVFNSVQCVYRKSKSDDSALTSITPFYVIVGGNIHKAVWFSCFQKLKDEDIVFSPLDYPSTCPLGDPDAQRVRLDISKNHIINPFNQKPLANLTFNGAIYCPQELDELIHQSWKDKKFYKDSKARWPTDYINWLSEDDTSDKFYQQLIDEQIITALVTHKQIIQNPKLTDWQFFKKQDAHSCLQEISMFLGNISAPDQVPVIIEDKYRIQQHGFDNQSFKKAPTKNANPKLPKRPYP